jgi:hypothetical protein
MATVESAVLSGLQAARELWSRAPLGDPIAIAAPDVHSDAALLAVKLALTPHAYWAKWWSTALDSVSHLARGDLAKGVGGAAGMLLLPPAYAVDWWQTAYALWQHLFFDRKRSPRRR